MDKESIEQPEGTSPSLLPPLSRRAFLAGAATCAAVAPTMLQAAVREIDWQTLLHVATRASQYRICAHLRADIAMRCTLLGTTAVDSFAALAVHPALPLLYVARDCREWENLPRGVIESYAVECGAHPLRLLAQTPMALSAIGPAFTCRFIHADDTCSFRHPWAERGMPLFSTMTACQLPSQSPAKKPEPCWTRILSPCQRRIASSFRLMSRSH